MIEPELILVGVGTPPCPPPPTLDLPSASRYVEYLKKLPSWAEAERELQGKSADELRGMVLVQLASWKRQRLTSGPDDQEGMALYDRWSRVEPL